MRDCVLPDCSGCFVSLISTSDTVGRLDRWLEDEAGVVFVCVVGGRGGFGESCVDDFLSLDSNVDWPPDWRDERVAREFDNIND